LNRAVRQAVLRTVVERLWEDRGTESGEILGRVYERLLEKEIRIVGEGRTVRTAAPDRRRAGGVYYTPGCIVDYIVRNAIGPLLTGRHPLSTPPLKILDPACGAGSFLIGTYRFLLDWHRGVYASDGPERHARGRNPSLCRGPDGVWRLTPAERKRILLSSVFGVDLDPEAVELAKQALVLTMDEGSRDSSDKSVGNALRGVPGRDTVASMAIRGTPRRAFPTDFYPGIMQCHWETFAELASNLRCGDSLLVPGVVRVPGDGFDAVVGNPPYRRERGSKSLLENLAGTAFGEKYRAARMDLWYYFAHRSLELLRPGGVLSFIVSAYWTAGAGAEKLVASLQRDAHLDELFLLDNLPVFPKVAGRHMIVRLVKQRSDRPTTIKRAPRGSAATAEALVTGALPATVFEKSAEQVFRAGRVDLEPPADSILARLDRWPPLGELGMVRQGIAENPAAINAKTNAAFGNRWQAGQGVFALRPAELERLDLSSRERALLRPYYDPGDVARYAVADRPSLHLIYSTKSTCPDIGQYPRLQAHLERFRPIMEARRETRQGSNRWWHLHWPRDEAVWQSSKILCLQFARRPSFVAVERPAYVPFSVNVVVPRATTPESLSYLCGLLNSRLLWTWYEHHAKRRGVGLEINGRVLARTPIRRIDFSEADQRTRHDEIAGLAQTMLDLTRQHRTASTAPQEAALAEQLEAADRRLDLLVYHLYGLTHDEIAQIE